MQQDNLKTALAVLQYPFDPTFIQRKKRSLKRDLSEMSGMRDVRVAVLGGSTTAEIVDMLELFLLSSSIRPTFYQCEYGKYYEDVMFENSDLFSFKPQLLYFHTSVRNCPEFSSAQSFSCQH